MKKEKNQDLLSELLGNITPEEQAKTDKKMILATKIANAIKAKGLNKSEFTTLMGKDHQSEISRWLSGTHNFTTDTLLDIEQVLSIQLIDTKNWDSFEKYEKVNVRPKPSPANIYRLAS
jgi:transcriptional regulator with XRE-family HTH domain